MEAERKRAHNWYWWLWLSPLLTIPTLVTVMDNQIGRELLCGGFGSCNREFNEKISLLLAILISSLWHLLLLKPAVDKLNPFVRWHGRQALSLAGLRTAVPLAFVVIFGVDIASLLAIPILILIWFLGTLIAQQQSSAGSCSLARLAGREDEVACYQVREPASRSEQEKVASGSEQEWVNIIRFSEDPQERRQALSELKSLDMVEDF